MIKLLRVVGYGAVIMGLVRAASQGARARVARSTVRNPQLIAAGVLLAVACFWAPSPSLRLGRFMLLAYATIAGCGILITRRSLPLGLAFIWAAVIAYAHPATSLLFALALVCFGVGLLCLLSRSNRPYATYSNRLCDCICLIALANVAWQAMQLAGLPVFPRDLASTPPTLVGLQTNPEETSALLAVCLPAFWRARWRWMLPVPLAGLVMAQNMVGVGAAAAVGVLAVLTNRHTNKPYTTWLLIGALVAALIGFFVLFGRGAGEWQHQKGTRLLAWQKSASAAIAKPVFGWGFGQYSAVIPLAVSPHLIAPELRAQLWREIEDKKGLIDLVVRWSKGDPAYFAQSGAREIYLEAHNEYIETLFAAGIPGLALLLWAIAALLRKGRRHPLPFYGLLASCITALGFFSWQIVPIAAVTCVWAALCLAPRHRGGISCPE